MNGGIPSGTPVGVVGAGTMGAGIAQVAAAAGHPVFLYDADPARAAAACSSIAESLRKRVSKGKLSGREIDATVARLHAADTLSELKGAALVVEAVLEDLGVKQSLFAELEAILSPESLLATNTSSISVTAIGRGLARPERLAGMHFFNPAPVMRLVEIVSGLATDRPSRKRYQLPLAPGERSLFPPGRHPGSSSIASLARFTAKLCICCRKGSGTHRRSIS